MLLKRDKEIDWLCVTKDNTRRGNNVNRSFKHSVDRMLTFLHPEWSKERITEEERNKLVFHSLRHTFATRLANTGIPPEGHGTQKHRDHTQDLRQNRTRRQK